MMARKMIQCIKESIPEIGKSYHFFDDGKTSPSRHYMCDVVNIIPFDEMNNEDVVSAWKFETREKQFLFSKETDYFIEGLCDEYINGQPCGKYSLWFARTVDGGWFSLDYPMPLMGGRLDVDEKLLSRILESMPDYLELIKEM